MMVPLAIGPGLNTIDTAFVVHPMPSLSGAAPGWIDMDKARFWGGQPQPIGGWESFVATPLSGVCRSIQPWADPTGTLNVAFGTHSHLQLFLSGVLYDITPVLALPPAALNANPLTTSSGSPTVVVSQAGHPFAVGDSNTLSGVTLVNGLTPNGTFAVTAVTQDTWSFNAGSSATGNGSGGGSAAVVTPQRAFAAGAVDGTGGAGFGTGGYGTGGYSQPSTANYFPATWSQDNYGQSLIACPRGGTIYQWNNNTGTPAAPLLNAPAKVNYALVTPQRDVVAIGCNQALSGVYNPMNIRGSDLEDPTDWFPTTSNNAWEETLEGGGYLVAAAMVGDFMFVWSDTCVWQGQFIGDPGQTWRFTKCGESCGLIGPNAFQIVSQTAMWMAPDGNYWSCALNGEPQLMTTHIGQDVLTNLAPGQKDKIVAAQITQFGEVWWFYPDARDGTEVSRYVGVSTVGGTWLHGTFDRTAFHAGSPAPYPIGVSAEGAAYYHEKGKTADGAAYAWFFESGGQYLGNADQRFIIKGVWPDLQGQVGAVQLTVFLRAYPQVSAAYPERTKGPFTLTPGQAKCSFMGDARIARVRIAGNSGPTGGRLGKFQFEAEASGLQ
jgi:hypothetical protein